MYFRKVQSVAGRLKDVDPGSRCPCCLWASHWAWHLVAADDGQDLIEYALLTSFIGLVGILAFQTLGDAMRVAFNNWNNGIQSWWEPSDPAGS